MPQESLFFEQSLKKLDVLYKFSGMYLPKTIKTHMTKQRLLFCINFFWVLSATFMSFYYIFMGMNQGKSLVELTAVAPCTIFTVLSMIKSFYHFKNENEIANLIQTMNKLEIKEKHREKSMKKDMIASRDRIFLNRVINVLYVLNFLMVVVFNMIPLVIIAVKYYKTNKFELLLPYLDVFSFIPYEFKYWPFAYIHQTGSECIVLLELGAADYLFLTCCMYIRIQFRLLQHDMANMIPESEEGMSDVVFQAKFTELVIWHQDIIASSDTLEKIYSKSNLFNFLASSLVICLTGFNITIVADVAVVMTYLTFLLMGLLQVLFLCFFADLMMSASMEVSDAVYSCRWYLTDVSARRELLLVILRSQEPCKLTASGFADVNLNAFMRILSSSWSYFALLQTMYGG